MKPVAVLDCGVVFSGAGWRRKEPWLVLLALARRRFVACATQAMLDELMDVADRRRDQWPKPAQAMNLIEWYVRRVRRVEPAPLGKRRSRDVKDDPYLAAALGAGAQYVVSQDPHLTDLEKPFGVEIVTPRQFLSRLAGI